MKVVRKLKKFSLMNGRENPSSNFFCHFSVMLEPCEEEEEEEEDLEAEADSPDMEPGTEMDQGEQSKQHE